MGGQTRPFNYCKLHEGQRRIWEDTHHPTINSVGLLVQTRSIFPWLVRVVSDRSVRYNGKHPKFHRRSFLNMQIYGTQNKCLQILFSNNPNNFFSVIPNVCLSKCVFHFLNLKIGIEYLLEEIYAWVRAHFPEHRLLIEPRAKTVRKKVQKEV